MRATRLALACALVVCVALLGACAKAPTASKPAAPVVTKPVSAEASTPLPASAYYMKEGLPKWVDKESGYDTTRSWKLEGGEWPVMLIMSPSQSPHALYGFQQDLFGKKLKPFGITPKLERIDGPPRTFHAMERSQWPFVYMPLAVFEDYTRSPKNQGDAGGLQYVALAGSTAGGGYTLISKDPSIKTVADLKGKKVALQNTNPVPGTLLTKAAKNAGLAIGDGPNDIHINNAPGGEQMNKYEKGEFDAMVTLNIYKAALFKTGSHAVTDFADVGYRPNYTILVVERTVLEKRPDVVKAFLEAHYAADATARTEWASGAAVQTLFESWNGFFKAQNTKWSTQRPVADTTAYKAMLGNMQPDIRLDRDLLDACFTFNSTHGNWGWPGKVDAAKMVDYEPFNEILKANGQPLQ